MDSRHKRLALATAIAMLASSCSMLPPSLRKESASQPAAGPATDFGPRVAPAVTDSPVARPKVFQGTGVFVNSKPPAAATPPGPEEASLNFESLDVREVAKVILGDYLKESYTVHPAVTGTVTFRTVRPIPMKDLLPTLEMLLRQNNAAVVKEDGVYKILPVAAVRGSVSPQLGGSNVPLPSGYSVLVVPLKYVGAREMAKLLEPFAADNTIRIDENRNLVVMAGNQRELRHLVETIELFDVDWLAGYSVGLFPVKSADVKSMVQDLEKVFGPGQQSPLSGIVKIVPMERMNALLVVTTQPRYLELARTWLDRFDQMGGASSGGSKFYVYSVKNGKAENLAQLVGDLFSSRRSTTSSGTLAPGARPATLSSSPFGAPQAPQTTTTTVTPSPSVAFQLPGAGGITAGEVRVIADKDTNSLLILASPSDYDVVEGALKKLDVARRQVLVEVLLAEVTLTDDLKFGIDWFLRAKGGSLLGTQNTSGTLPTGTFSPVSPITTPAGSLSLPATTVATQLGTVANYATGLQLINLTGGEVRAVLQALGTDGKTQVLAAPQVMVLDNEKAEIKVGNKISVQTQTQTGVSTGTGVVNSFQYLDTGVLLGVTPRINSGGMVTLEINQEVSAAGDTPAGNPNPNVNTRSAKTSVQVASGESIVLGGLIQENRTRSDSGIPLLSKIPILGAAFGTQHWINSRTELVMMVTPKIVSDPNQARAVTDELRKQLPSLESLLPKRPTTPPPPASAEPVAK